MCDELCLPPHLLPHQVFCSSGPASIFHGVPYVQLLLCRSMQHIYIFFGSMQTWWSRVVQVCVCVDEENGEQDVNDAQLLCERSLRATHSVKPPHLAPHQHGAEHHLQAVEEVVPDEDDGGAAGRPALARADGFDAGRGCFGYTGT